MTLLFQRGLIRIKNISANQFDQRYLRSIYFEWNADDTDVPTQVNTDQNYQRKSA